MGNDYVLEILLFANYRTLKEACFLSWRIFFILAENNNYIREFF